MSPERLRNEQGVFKWGKDLLLLVDTSYYAPEGRVGKLIKAFNSITNEPLDLTGFKIPRYCSLNPQNLTTLINQPRIPTAIGVHKDHSWPYKKPLYTTLQGRYPHLGIEPIILVFSGEASGRPSLETLQRFRPLAVIDDKTSFYLRPFLEMLKRAGSFPALFFQLKQEGFVPGESTWFEGRIVKGRSKSALYF